MDQQDRQPELIVIVDTEEEFDWSGPFARRGHRTGSVAAQAAAHDIFDRLGIVPTYVVDYPVATNPVAVAALRRLVDSGRAVIGAHLHPWVTPPHEETVGAYNSYHCNLPPWLERAKLEALTEAIEAGFGQRPRVFKAGRYGFGVQTLSALAELGYLVDCSYLPHHDLSGDGGPDYVGAPEQPFWLDRHSQLLELPLTVGFYGPLARFGPRLGRLFEDPLASRLRLPGLLSRARLLGRARLTPESVTPDDQCRLLDSEVARGRRVFTLAYHSPSLAPGNTPYVKSEADLLRFLANLEDVLVHFRDKLGGGFTTPLAVHERLSGEGDRPRARVWLPRERRSRWRAAAPAGRAALG